jgi:hypothetical protein
MRRLTPAQRVHAICAFVVPIVLVLLFAPATQRDVARETVSSCEHLAHAGADPQALAACRDALAVADD